MDLSYDQNSVTQKYLGDMLSNYLWTALSSYAGNSSVTIADFGVATGLNSCKCFKPVLERFRASSEAPVSLYHTDRPENHWNALFTNLSSSPDSYQCLPNVYSFAVGKSFYTQLFPPNSLDIAYACAAFHWLSQPVPCNLLSPPIFPLESTSLVSAQRNDLTTLLRLRYSELKPGGHLIFNLPGFNPGHSIFHPLIEVATEMKEAELLPTDYLETFPIPLASGSTEANLAVVRSFEREFEVVNTETVFEELPLYRQYRETGDLEAFVKAFAGFSRSYLYPYLKGICTQGEEGEALIQLFFAKLEDKVRSRPDPICMTQCYFHLKKQLR